MWARRISTHKNKLMEFKFKIDSFFDCKHFSTTLFWRRKKIWRLLYWNVISLTFSPPVAYHTVFDTHNFSRKFIFTINFSNPRSKSCLIKIYSNLKILIYRKKLNFVWWGCNPSFFRFLLFLQFLFKINRKIFFFYLIWKDPSIALNFYFSFTS